MRLYKISTILLLAGLLLSSCSSKNKELADKILADQTMQEVDSMARQLMKNGFYAGSGYQMVWSRDLNTFIELSCEEYDNAVIRENLLMFFHFQQANGELLDGYVPREAFTWGDPNTYESETAPGHIGFKNTVETDQETSLIQAIYKYVAKTGDKSILAEEVAGKPVYERLKWSINYLLNERYAAKYGLITGATTFDWGDVQVEGGAVVDVDSLTHWSIDVYDNAMLAIALDNLAELTDDNSDKQRWKTMQKDLLANIRKYLWDTESSKFIPHIYLDGSPFPDDFNENEIHYHGGTAVAIEAGVLTRDEIAAVLKHMVRNVEQSGAPSIGLTLYPTYPSDVLGKNVSAPYEYQNGGDWTWFGGRMIQQLIVNDMVDEAYQLVQPMMNRVIKNKGFYEWYKIDGTPAGSGDFKGSAGVLGKSIELFNQWAEENK
ncbi:hypothetical protein D1614_07940 [Maribellus luteus]|uniref:Glycosyl hydrolase 94 catalytic domain-containing protein n=1 Tax=Maribellus luteus TaxID=2305463 RepID=A0A399T3W4_9BACT|nr:amylo-alpha-1,6-glucosidase [Maribellus luteus]RIJ49462.1 hypothetical protein D1614_07940 [Maribellus luteus]